MVLHGFASRSSKTLFSIKKHNFDNQLTWTRKILDKIPLIRSIYNPLKKFAEIVLSDQTQSFSKVLLIEYPRKGVYSLCFQTSKEVGEIKGKIGDDVVCVYIPTTPNPTSGYIIMVSKDEVIELEMSVEDAIKMIISLGVVVPAIGGKE